MVIDRKIIGNLRFNFEIGKREDSDLPILISSYVRRNKGTTAAGFFFKVFSADIDFEIYRDKDNE